MKYTDKENVYSEGESELRVLKLPARLKHLSYDLTDGYVRMRDGGTLFCSPVDEDPGLKGILRWILANKSKFQLKSGDQSDCMLNTDFITYRGIFTKIMCSPFETREGWCVVATKYKGTIYLYEYATEKKMEYEMNRDEKANMFSYGGFRFEHFITEPADQSNDSDVNFQKHNEYCCIVRSRLGKHSLVYGAEMDCVDKSDHIVDPELEHFCEIKTTRTVDNQRQWDNLVRFKMLKWWAQCYLINTPTLVCGYRNDNMIVREIEVMKVSEMPKMATDFWSPHQCLKFLSRFLDFVKSVVLEDDPHVMYEFDWEPNQDVRYRKVAVTAKRFVIPEWYFEAL